MTGTSYVHCAKDVKLRAHGRWDEILRCLGVDERILSRKNMPCPLCGGTDRFQYTDRFQEGNYHCRNPDCGPGGGFKLLQAVRGWDFATALRKVSECVSAAPPRAAQDPPLPGEQMKLLARRIWNEACPVRAGDDVDRYLSSRGLGLDHYPATLRCHPRLGYYERAVDGAWGGSSEGTRPPAKARRVAEYPAMLARIDGPDGELVSLHRTYLENGRRAALPDAKKVLAPGVNGASVRLFDCGQTLALTEGIETALAVHLLRSVPVWAGLSAGNLEKLWIPPHVRHVLVFGGNDATGQFDGQASAYALARRLRKQAAQHVSTGEGPARECKGDGHGHGDGASALQVQVHIPRKAGADWADVWWSVVQGMKRTN